MKVTITTRVKNGWSAQETEMTPANAKILRSATRAKLKTLREAKPKETDFKLTKPGEITYVRCSGTCTELNAAGVCVACLGTNKKCEFCNGSGDC